MKHGRPKSAEQQVVDAGINRVLLAERDSRDAVAACRREAEQIVRTAEQAAAAIAGRVEARVRAAHGIADRGVEHALAALREPLRGDEGRVDLSSSARLEAVIVQMARELASPTNDGAEDD